MENLQAVELPSTHAERLKLDNTVQSLIHNIDHAVMGLMIALKEAKEDGLIIRLKYNYSVFEFDKDSPLCIDAEFSRLIDTRNYGIESEEISLS